VNDRLSDAEYAAQAAEHRKEAWSHGERSCYVCGDLVTKDAAVNVTVFKGPDAGTSRARHAACSS
jgi:hypothetical protein